MLSDTDGKMHQKTVWNLLREHLWADTELCHDIVI
jgi:hypothetical protein